MPSDNAANPVCDRRTAHRERPSIRGRRPHPPHPPSPVADARAGSGSAGRHAADEYPSTANCHVRNCPCPMLFTQHSARYFCAGPRTLSAATNCGEHHHRPGQNPDPRCRPTHGDSFLQREPRRTELFRFGNGMVDDWNRAPDAKAANTPATADAHQQHRLQVQRRSRAGAGNSSAARNSPPHRPPTAAEEEAASPARTRRSRPEDDRNRLTAAHGDQSFKRPHHRVRFRVRRQHHPGRQLSQGEVQSPARTPPRRPPGRPGAIGASGAAFGRGDCLRRLLRQ